MQESSVYQHLIETAAEERYQQGIEQGIEEGARQTSIENTLTILNTRFPDADLQTLTPALEPLTTSTDSSNSFARHPSLTPFMPSKNDYRHRSQRKASPSAIPVDGPIFGFRSLT